MSKVLFVTNKWATGSPGGPLTNNFHNLFNSFAQVRNEYYDTLFIDESQFIYGKHINDILPGYCLATKTDIVIICLLADSHLNPSLEVCKVLKNSNIKICFIWPDSHPFNIKQRLELQSVTDLNAIWDNRTPSTTNLENDWEAWVPQDETMFFSEESKHINVSFIGSLRQPLRESFLRPLHNIFITGGQNETNLTAYKYSDLIRNSKISLNFSGAMGFNQTKGRVYEILACNTLLMENVNDSTRKRFKPGVEYVEFDSPDDLANKINYYLSNEEERKMIAKKGNLKYQQEYSTTKFWNTLMDKLNETA